MLPRMGSALTSRSNWTEENSALRVGRPMLVAVLNGLATLVDADTESVTQR